MRKNFEKLLAIVIAVCMFATMFSLPAVTFADTWDGSTISEGLSGTGTEEDPFIIATAADFAYFAEQSRGGDSFTDQYVKLDDDISLGDLETAPLGEFSGVFDGNGHEISGISINTTSDNTAFFTSISGGTIKDLTLAGSITSTGAFVGGFAGYVVSTNFVNCVNNLDVTGRAKVGGFCGSAISGGSVEIVYCTNNGNITATNTENYSFLGGLIGEIQKESATSYATVSIICSQNTGTVVSKTRTVLGGLVGQNRGDLTITNCINSGSVIGATQIGGIVANVNNDAISLTVQNTINVGKLSTIRTTGATAHIGAILGYYAEKANSETFENAFYRNSDYDFNGANDGQTVNTPRGTVMDTATDWTDGTIVALLNGDAEEPVFEQGENYPVLIAKKDSGDECEHTGGIATCHSKAICDTCGEEYGEFDLNNHDGDTEIRGATDATETEDGYTGDTYCLGCGEKIADGEVIPATGESDFDVWDGTTVSEGLAGTGTEEDPFIIATAADFAYFAEQSRGGDSFTDQYVGLDANISLGDLEISPLGGFNGTFDGKGHEISGIKIDTTSDNAAFFTSISGGTVKDLTLAGSITTTGAFAGGFAGYVSFANFVNCVNNINVTGRAKVGGFCGSVINDAVVNIISCTNNGNITATNTANYSFLGGLIGEIQKASETSYGTVNIIRSQNTGSVVSVSRNCLGGLVGQNRGDLTITNCINSGSVIGATQIGGIVANINNDAISLTIQNTINVGKLSTIRTTGATAHIGAILGYYAEKANSETFENAFYRNSDYDFNGANDGQTADTPRGTAMDTASDWTDGTIVALLNAYAEETVFEQGELYPVFAAVSDGCEHTDVASEWSSDEENHWHVCNTCGEPADVAAHASARWRCGKVATTEEDGLRYKICDVCGARFGDEVVPKIAMPVIEPGDGIPEIVVESKNAAPGKTVDVKVAIKNNPGIASMKLTVEFDEGLTLKTPVVYDIAPEETDPEMPQVIQPADSGGASPVILNWISPLANIEGDVIYATLTFEVAEDAEGEQNITVTYNPNDIYNLAEENIGFAVTNGKITVGESAYIAGDINGDGEVDNKDLTRLFQYLSNWDVEVNEPALDVNGDDSVDNKDLTRLFQYLSNWDVEIF